MSDKEPPFQQNISLNDQLLSVEITESGLPAVYHVGRTRIGFVVQHAGNDVPQAHFSLAELAFGLPDDCVLIVARRTNPGLYIETLNADCTQAVIREQRADGSVNYHLYRKGQRTTAEEICECRNDSPWKLFTSITRGEALELRETHHPTVEVMPTEAFESFGELWTWLHEEQRAAKSKRWKPTDLATVI